MARPKKDIEPEDRRDYSFRVRLSASERTKLDFRAAKIYGTGKGNIGDYARLILFADWKNPPPSARDPLAIRELAVQIRRVGNNVNQLANVANANKMLPEERVWRDALKKLMDALDAVEAL